MTRTSGHSNQIKEIRKEDVVSPEFMVIKNLSITNFDNVKIEIRKTDTLKTGDGGKIIILSNQGNNTVQNQNMKNMLLTPYKLSIYNFY